MVLGEPNLYHNLGDFTRKWGFYLKGCLTVKNWWELLTGDDGVDGGDFTWRVSDCEELVGVTHRR